jgi:hypothetical protein
MIFIPIGILLASLFSFYKGYKNWSAGSVKTTMPPLGGPVTTEESKKRLSWLSIGANIFGLILLALAIGAYIVVQSEK